MQYEVEGLMDGLALPNNVDAVLDQIEAQQTIELPENGTSLDLLQQVYRNPSLPLMTRMRAATAALPHEHPKLAVTTVVNAGDFADQLERAVERSRMIEAKPIIEEKVSTDNPSSSDTKSLNGKPTILDRRYRSW
jgi:hypothetical protein